MQKIKISILLFMLLLFGGGARNSVEAACEGCYGYVARMAVTFPSGQCYDVNACKSRCSTLAASCAACNGTLDYMATNVSFCQNSFCQDSCTNPTTPGNSGTYPLPNLNLSAGGVIDRMYGYHRQGFGDDGFNDCWEDGKGGGGKCVRINGHPTRGSQGCPTGPSFPGSIGGNMLCRFRDSEKPWASASPASISRQKTQPVVTINGKDDGGAGLGRTTGLGAPYGQDWQGYENGKMRYIWSYDGSNCFSDPKAQDLFVSSVIPGVQYSANVVMNREGSHYLHVCLIDNVGRTSDPYIFGPYQYDTVSPNRSNQQMTLKNNYSTKNILANNDAGNLKIIYDETNLNKAGCNIDASMADYNDTSCAPLKNVTYRYESATINDSYTPTSITENCDYPGYNCNKTTTWNVSKVDGVDGNDTDGKRIYNSDILQICDNANNCSVPKGFQWNLFANYPNWGNIANTDYNDNFFSTGVADGDVNLAGYAVIKDQFGNRLIPVADIGRIVNFNMTYSNSTQLNQYNNPANGGSSLFFNFEGQNKFVQSDANGGVVKYSQYCNANWDATCDNINQIKSGTGRYNFKLMAFAPNSYGYKYGLGTTSIYQLDSHIYDQGAVDRPGQMNDYHTFFAMPKSIKLSPLFTTNINGNPLISEGVGQQFGINITESTENGTKNKFASLTNIETVVKYNKGTQPINTFLTGGTSMTPSSALQGGAWITECIRGKKSTTTIANFGTCSDNSKNMVSAINIGTNSFGVGYTLAGGAAFGGQDVGNISTHFAVNFPSSNLYAFPSGVTSIWNSDIVGADNYVGGTSKQLTSQSPVKVLGIVGSSDFTSKSTQTLTGFAGSMDKAGQVEKASLNSAVRKKVKEFTRNITPITDVGIDIYSNPNYFSYQGFKIFYLKANGGTLVVNGNISSTDKIIVIVENGNVVINGDIQQTKNSLLGLIVLRGVNNTGNIYVKNIVTNLEALMYADGGVISFATNLNTTQESMAVNDLKNQIYIKGVLWVNNTLGGSRGATPKCPYFVDSASCDFKTAQKYDLSYLRKFYMMKTEDANHNLTHGWMPYGNGYLAGKVYCYINGDNIIKCRDDNASMNNNISDTVIGPNNPFGDKNSADVPASLKEDLGPIVLEYDSKVKTFSVPIFDVGL